MLCSLAVFFKNCCCFFWRCCWNFRFISFCNFVRKSARDIASSSINSNDSHSGSESPSTITWVKFLQTCWNKPTQLVWRHSPLLHWNAVGFSSHVLQRSTCVCVRIHREVAKAATSPIGTRGWYFAFTLKPHCAVCWIWIISIWRTKKLSCSNKHFIIEWEQILICRVWTQTSSLWYFHHEIETHLSYFTSTLTNFQGSFSIDSKLPEHFV